MFIDFELIHNSITTNVIPILLLRSRHLSGVAVEKKETRPTPKSRMRDLQIDLE